jgi:hypothetical protein
MTIYSYIMKVYQSLNPTLSTMYDLGLCEHIRKNWCELGLKRSQDLDMEIGDLERGQRG